jgi:hypothetical protein
MNSVETWHEALDHCQKIKQFDSAISTIMAKMAEIFCDSECTFGARSEEMNNIVETIMDFRQSKLEDLLQFIDIITERASASAFTSLQ